MLPIYEAIDLIEVISENVGHTKPWVVLANTPEGLKSFVTKLYSSEQVDQFHCISKEIVCNLLAREFDLNVPPCALIEIPEDLSLRLSPDAQLQYNNADSHLKFATLKLDNVNSAIRVICLNSIFKKEFQWILFMRLIILFEIEIEDKIKQIYFLDPKKHTSLIMNWL